ncbi:hypothetical protein [uncultured Imperialibacter sp.]|uniref:hypothetical protein n=1 Tax=uncultured Imperialibacter sp. TaxID=1672639 RepID=UPI0030DAF5E4|tara:strand:- start:209 stop:373 length:165 start_codon:yes stop_codon:yes gene_type:complete
MKKQRKEKSEGRNKENERPKKRTSVRPDKNQETKEESKFGGIPERDFKKNLGCG